MALNKIIFVKQITLHLALIVFSLSSLSAQEDSVLYRMIEAPIELRIKDLLSKMMIEEKVLQLNQYVVGINNNEDNMGEVMKKIPSGIGSLIYFGDDPVWRNQIQKKAMEKSRLGIPILFGFDVIHGFRTVYPIPLAQACSWNPELVTQCCQIAAKEACLSGIDWTFSPMIDIARDPRWGRVAESYGEDPYANAVFGVATVKGYQGKNLSDPYSVAACLKHYVGYGESEGGRDYNYSDISRQSLWETYLVPYEACVKAGAATLMSGFNDISGIPATANYYTLTEILKDRWGHDGFVVSDWDAVKQLIPQGVAKDQKEAGLKAFTAGVEMDMKDNIYREYLQELVNEQKISIQQIDDAVARVLRVKFRLGLFDEPYTTVIEEKERYLQSESMELAQKLAEESMVLLKNDMNLLPISKNIKTIAVIGPMVKDKENLMGDWSARGKPSDVVSLFEGLEKEFQGVVDLIYAEGCDFDGTDESGIDKAIATAQKSDMILVCLGEKKIWSGENASRSTIALPTIQEKLVQELKTTGKPIVLVLSNGRPIELVRLEPLADAILEIWQPGIAGGTAMAKILSGLVNPSGKLAITFPLTSGQIPVYYNMRQSARPHSGKYQDIPTEPLYWMGHGLSYTQFEYGQIKLSSYKISRNQQLKAEITVKNTGTREGAETVLWYISDPVCSISRPIKELKFFSKEEIKPGEQMVFTFEIDPERDLNYVDYTGKKLIEPGDFYIHINNQKVKFEFVE